MWIIAARRAAVSRWAGSAGVLAALLVGCSSGSAPRPSPLASHSGPVAAPSSPTPSRTLSREDEVVAVVRQYFAALDLAVSTGDTSRVEKLSHPKCTCMAVVTSVHKEFANGGRTDGAHWRVTQVKLLGFDGSAAYVNAVETTSAYRSLDRTGAVLAAYPERSTAVVVGLSRLDGAWVVGSLSGNQKS